MECARSPSFVESRPSDTDSLRRVLSLASALPASSSALNLALQALKEGSEGLKWVAGNTFVCVSFANRNVVMPALRKVASTASSSGRSALDTASESTEALAQMRFAQTRGRAGRIVLHGATRRSARSSFEAPAWTSEQQQLKRVAVKDVPVRCTFELKQPTVQTFEEKQQEAADHEHMHFVLMGLQSSLL